jgi:hypothetical protein
VELSEKNRSGKAGKIHFPKSVKRKWVILICAGLIVQLVIMLGCIYYGMQIHRSGRARTISEFMDGILISKFAVLKNYFSGLTARPERLQVDIQYLDFQKLVYKRQEALDLGRLIVTEEDYVPATITFRDSTLAARIRLKGDWLEHLMGEKWSFRIKIRGENTLMGIKQFSIHHPHTRNYLYEWLYHEALNREGIITPRYGFVEVVLNGKNLGIYALEEHFEKRLLENNRRREGPIVRFEEDLFWESEAFKSYVQRDAETYLTSNIDIFQTNKYLGDSIYRGQFQSALFLLESFRLGELATSRVFDIDLLARYAALSDLFGAQHGQRWHNRRFYFNPISAKLEPIGFDSGAGGRLEAISYVNSGDSFLNRRFQDTFFADTVFLKKYIRELERISNPVYLDNLLSESHSGIRNNLKLLYREFPYYIFSTDQFYFNQKTIRNYLNPAKGLHAYLNRVDEDGIELTLGNIQNLPIEVLGLKYGDSLTFMPSRSIILAPKAYSSHPVFENSYFAYPKEAISQFEYKDSLFIQYRIFGTDSVRTVGVYPWPHPSLLFSGIELLGQKSNESDFEFLIRDTKNKSISIKPGQWTLKRDLIIPEGYTFICSENTSIDLINSACIISRSPLVFTGANDGPISFYSSDSSGQGLLVMAGKQASVLENAVFDNLSYPRKGLHDLTGTVTFYESPVTIRRCTFKNNRSEDALNIVRSDFAIHNCLFLETSNDALDADFSDGEILATNFKRCGNDAIDISGSVVKLYDLNVNGAGDKGLSVGENSAVIVTKAVISNAFIGLASKDLSELKVEDITVSECGTGFAAYQKKAEFGPSSINISGLDSYSVDKLFLVESNSVIISDGIAIDVNTTDAPSELYGTGMTSDNPDTVINP